MTAAFRPDVTIAALLAGEGQPGQRVRVAGRAFNLAEDGFELADGPRRLPVALRPGAQSPTVEAAWVGVAAQWSRQQERLQDALVEFLHEPRLSIAQAAGQGLPEAGFLAHPDRLAAIQARADLGRWVGSFLEARGFLAVQTPFLRTAAEVAYLEQYETQAINGQTLYLRTDPEEYLKRYLTAGLEAVYEISTNVRGERPDANRLQEFTSVECYRRFWTFAEALATSADLVTGALLALRGETATRLHGQPVDLTPPLLVRSFAELVQEATGLALDQYPTAVELAQAIRSRGWWAGVGSPLDQFRRTWLEWLLEKRVIPSLSRPTFIVDFPVELGLSYRERPDRPGVCFRGELILPGGFELVHVYENITDLTELRTRYEERLHHRIAAGLPPVALDEALLQSAALGMPPMAGLAIGLDRLLLLVLGRGIVGDGLLFPRQGFAGEV